MPNAAAPDGKGAPVEFEFVVGNRPDQLKGGSTTRLRSYLSRRAWQAHLPTRPAPSSSSSSSPAASAGRGSGDAHAAVGPRRPRRRRWGKALYSVTFEYVAREDEPAGTGPLPQAEAREGDDEAAPGALRHLHARRGLTMRRPSPDTPIEYQLGGGRVDPFRSYPGPWRSIIPALTDHYIVHMARDIPELDQPGNAGLLRSRWFPCALSHASTFTVVLLLSAANYITNLGPPSPAAGGGGDMLGFATVDAFRLHLRDLHQAAIAAINDALRDPRRRLSDEVVGAVAKMASFEAMHGDVASYRMHMHGLRLMLDLRGGMDSLGLGGLLRRMIVWIDLNGSFLLGVERYFPGHTFTGKDEVTEPNPARFIAVREAAVES